MHSSWEKLCLCARPVQRDKPHFPKGSQLLAQLDCSGSVQLRSEQSPPASKATAPHAFPGARRGHSPTLIYKARGGSLRAEGVIFHLFLVSKFQESIQTGKSGASGLVQASPPGQPSVPAQLSWLQRPGPGKGPRRVHGGLSPIPPPLLLFQPEQQPFHPARVRAGKRLSGVRLSRSGESSECKRQGDGQLLGFV